ncbi:MAG: ABC transporter ATP-binding protein [Candidatus Micrarchaeota archaeon]
MRCVISVKGVSKTYRSGGQTIKALEGAALDIREGEIFGLLGPNGAGKTTLISILAGILSPDSGEASVCGVDCIKRSKEVQKNLNVMSGFTGVPFSLSCEEALTYYCLLYNVPDSKAKIDEVLRIVGLEGARKLEVEDFSAGMKQKFQIGKALLSEPKVLIMDEPTVGLDVESAISIREMIKRLRKEGRTILLTTHNMFEAEELCDRIAFINHGKVLDVGTVPELKEKIIGERVIEVNCSDSDAVLKALGRIGGVKASLHSPRLVHVSVDSYRRMKDIMRALSGSGAEIYNVSALEPTLEETYLKLINKKPSARGRRKEMAEEGETGA